MLSWNLNTNDDEIETYHQGVIFTCAEDENARLLCQNLCPFPVCNNTTQGSKKHVATIVVVIQGTHVDISWNIQVRWVIIIH